MLEDIIKKPISELTYEQIQQIHTTLTYGRFNAMAEVIERSVYAGDKASILYEAWELVESHRGFHYEWLSSYADMVVELIIKERRW